MLSVCPFYGDVSFDHWIMVLSARLLHCVVTSFPL